MAYTDGSLAIFNFFLLRTVRDFLVCLTGQREGISQQEQSKQYSTFPHFLPKKSFPGNQSKVLFLPVDY